MINRRHDGAEMVWFLFGIQMGRLNMFKRYALVAVALAALAQPALAQQSRRVPASAADVRTSFAPVVRNTAPAVVNVYSERRTTGRSGNSTADRFSFGPVPAERVQQSLGSGAIVRDDGIVVTNNHVIEKMDEIRVVLADRREFPARVLLADPRSDVAVLKIDAPAGEKFPIIRIDAEDAPEVGDLVLAIGNPFGVGQTVTNGIISALSRTDIGITDYSFFIQTDAAINPGNSGGPLVDMDGDLIGLNTAIYSQTGGSVGISFAIPAAMVRQVVASAVAGSTRVERPWLGAQIAPITREVAQSLGLPGAQGVQVKQVYPGGPADKGGVRPGDILLAINGETVNDDSAVNYRVGTRKSGDQASLKVLRAGAERALTVSLSIPPSAPAESFTVTGRNPFEGLTISNLSPATAEEKGIDPFLKGVAVTDVSRGMASRTGLKQGDIILEINGVTIDSTRKMQDVLKSSDSQWEYAVQRGAQVVRFRQAV